MAHCNDKSCGIDHHHGHHEQSCGSGCGCGCSECKCACHQKEGCFSDQLLEMADEAWMELLHEKIKKHIESISGKELDKLAAIVSKANHARWKEKMDICKTKDDFKEQISNFFHK